MVGSRGDASPSCSIPDTVPAAPVLAPFAVAAVLAYLGDRLVDKFEEVRLPRAAAVLTVFVFLTMIGVLQCKCLYKCLLLYYRGNADNQDEQ